MYKFLFQISLFWQCLPVRFLEDGSMGPDMLSAFTIFFNVLICGMLWIPLCKIVVEEIWWRGVLVVPYPRSRGIALTFLHLMPRMIFFWRFIYQHIILLSLRSLEISLYAYHWMGTESFFSGDFPSLELAQLLVGFAFRIGPGCSSIGNGAFTENGPFRVTLETGTLIENIFSWNKGFFYILNILGYVSLLVITYYLKCWICYNWVCSLKYTISRFTGWSGMVILKYISRSCCQRCIYW